MTSAPGPPVHARTINSPAALLVQWARRKWFKIVIDVLLLLGFVAEFLTREGPNYVIHSWTGVVLVPIITLHLAGSLGWIKRVWARKRQDRDINLGLLNATLGLLSAICIATGFPIWLEWSEASAWAPVHTVTGFASLITMLVHLWMNRTRIMQLVNH